MTLRTLADLGHVLGHRFSLVCGPITDGDAPRAASTDRTTPTADQPKRSDRAAAREDTERPDEQAAFRRVFAFLTETGHVVHSADGCETWPGGLREEQLADLYMAFVGAK